MPAGAVYVGRPTVFGNPVVIDDRCTPKEAVAAYRWLLFAPENKVVNSIFMADGSAAVITVLGMIIWRKKVLRLITTLRGKDLACWCPLDQPCHADILLWIANR